jgi:TolB-like protein/DNA-binding winged helix-turn-helix (wHTH) protein/Flp pilus assembly protein TadD
MAAEMKELYQFATFRLEVARRRLSRNGEVLPISSKVFETLLVLVRNRDRVVVKDELMQAVWPDSFVEEVNLAQNISALRKIFGEAPGENLYIATIPGRGYHFVADVRVLPEDEGEVLVQRQTTTKVVIEEESDDETGSAVAKPMRALRPAPWRLLGLGKVTWLGLLLAVGVALAGWYAWRRSVAAEATPPHALAVLPFQPLTSSGDEYLGLGMTDAVITRLTNIKQLIVRPTSSVLRYAGTKTDPLQAGRELGVESVLDGKVQKSGERIRVTVQMIDVKTGRPLWAETFDEDFTNVFNFEDSISQKVVAALPVALAGQERQQLARNYTGNPEAYENYIKGRYAEFRFTPEGLNTAIEYFNRAIALDPGYALAYAGLADAYTTASEGSLSPREALPKAEAAARKAVALDDNLAEAHAALAHSLMHQWKLEDARKEFQRALALNPNNTAFYFTYGEYLTALGRFDDAIAEANKAIQLDPLSTENYMMLAWANYLKHDYDGDLAAGRKALQIEPDFMPAHWCIAAAYLFQGRYPEAIASFQKAADLSDDDPMALSGLASAYARSGNRSQALRAVEEMKQKSSRHYVAPLTIALAYGDLGNKDEAFAWLNKAYDDRSEYLLWLNTDPSFDSVRSDTRFQELVRKVGAQVR